MDKEEVRKLVQVRYQVAHYFVPLLQKVLERVPEGPIKDNLRDNLEEEIGISRIHPGLAHREGRRRLLEAIGVNYDEWQPRGSLDRLNPKLHPAARRTIEEFKELFGHPDWQVAVAAFAAYENLVPLHYARLVDLLRAFWPQLSDDDMWHLLDHIEHDAYHGGGLDELLNQLPNQAAIAEGRSQAQEIWRQFWDSL